MKLSTSLEFLRSHRAVVSRDQSSRTIINKFEGTVSLATSADHVFPVNVKLSRQGSQTGESSRKVTFIATVESVSIQTLVVEQLETASQWMMNSLARSTISRKHSARNLSNFFHGILDLRHERIMERLGRLWRFCPEWRAVELNV